LVADAKESGWWEAYTEVDEEYATFIGLEQAATAIDQFEGSIVPAFLQTGAYGEAFLRGAVSPARKKPLSDHDIAKRIEVRVRRQQLLSTDSGVRYTAIIDEGALLRPVGGGAVMREQISRLLQATERTATEILILPLARGAHPGQERRFTILSLPQARVSDVVYIDSFAGQLFLETPEELDRHRRVFGTLRGLSLDVAASQEALRSKITDLCQVIPPSRHLQYVSNCSFERTSRVVILRPQRLCRSRSCSRADPRPGFEESAWRTSGVQRTGMAIIPGWREEWRVRLHPSPWASAE
jgi:hypothetical protein